MPEETRDLEPCTGSRRVSGVVSCISSAMQSAHCFEEKTCKKILTFKRAPGDTQDKVSVLIVSDFLRSLT